MYIKNILRRHTPRGCINSNLTAKNNKAKNFYTIYFVFDSDGECKFIKTKHYSYQSSHPASRSSGACALLMVTGIWTVLCILSVTWPMMMQTRTSIIHFLLYTLHYTLSLLHSTLSARSPLSLPLPHFRGLRSVPLQPISSATTASPDPLPERVVVGRRSHSSDHHTPIPSRFSVR